jgi:hypothetical protein
MRCPECGLENMPQVARCLRCGRGLESEFTPWSEVVPPRRADRGARRMQAYRQRLRGRVRETITDLGEQVRALPGDARLLYRRLLNLLWYHVDSQDRISRRRSPTLAMALSFIPGLGHLYARERREAGVLLAAFAGALLLALATMRTPVFEVVLAGVVCLQLVAMIAAGLAVRSQTPDVAYGGGPVSAVLLSVGLLAGMYTTGLWATSHAFALAAVGYDLTSARIIPGRNGVTIASGEVVLRDGDRLLIRRLGKLNAGDIVLTQNLAGEDLAVQRLLAGPGDTFVVAGEIRRNGRIIDADTAPLVPLETNAHIEPMSWRGGAGEYLAVPYTVLEAHHGVAVDRQVSARQPASYYRRDIVGKVIAVY